MLVAATACLWVAAWLGSAAQAEPEEGCPLSLQQGQVVGGGRELKFSAASDGTCHCPRFELSYRPCNGSCPHSAPGWTVMSKLPAARDGDTLSASTVVFLTGRYRARCCPDRNSGCYWSDVAEAWVDGINYSTWNVCISSEQVGGSKAQLSVEVTCQTDPSSRLDFYFSELSVRVTNATDRIGSEHIAYPGSGAVVFGQDGGLRPGEYEVRVRPPYSVCSSGCRSRFVTYVISAPRNPSVGEVSVDETSGKSLYVTLGVLAGVVVAGVFVYLSYRLLYGQRGRRWLERLQSGGEKRPLSAEPLPAVTVLVLHQYGALAARQPLLDLAAALRAAGLQVLDVRDGFVFNLLQSHPSPADALALEVLRDARLIFVAGAGGADRVDSAAARVYDSFLKYVRNGQLGQDYGRVFTVSLEDADGAELAGMVEGRLFRVPVDVPLLVEHLRAPRPPVARLCSAESGTDLLPAVTENPA